MRRAALLALVSLVACEKQVTIAECRLPSDCPTAATCVEGRCVFECHEARDCEAGERCAGGRCEPETPLARLCIGTRDCPVGETCLAGLCRPVSFVSDAPDAGPARDAEGSASSPDAAWTTKPYGAVCSASDECDSAVCMGPGATGGGRCTIPCARNADCSYPDSCIEALGARFCAVAPSLGGTGASCPNGPSDCSTGACLDAPSGPICTHQCLPLPTCPAGMHCEPADDGTGGALAVCVPGAGGGFGEGCRGASDCATSLCVAVGSSSAGICTSSCDTVACPLGWTCVSASQGARVCAPEGAVGGAFGAACNSASSCANGLCLHDARTMTGFCTIPCSGHADCAAVSGLLCVALTGGARVCGPP